MKKTSVLMLITALTIILNTQATLASQYLQSFCRSNDLESLKIQLNVSSSDITTLLTYTAKNSEPEVQTFNEQLYSEGALANEDIAYLSDDLTRWENLNSEIMTGQTFVGADDITDETSVTRIYYILKAADNTEYLYVKNSGLYYYGSSANCSQ